MSTGELDRFADEFIRSHQGAVPAFKGLYGFPGSVCTSVNEEVVHGIPSFRRKLKEGDILSIDVGVRLDGWCSDSAWTFPVGEVDEETRNLLRVTEESLYLALEAAVVGNHVGDIGAAVVARVEGTGYGIIRDLVGHGLGREVHEEPQVPNVGKAGSRPPPPGGDGPGHRTHVERGDRSDPDPGGPVDGGHGGSDPVGPFRAYDCCDPGWTAGPDRVRCRMDIECSRGRW